MGNKSYASDSCSNIEEFENMKEILLVNLHYGRLL